MEKEAQAKFQKAVSDLNVLRESLDLTVHDWAGRADMNVEHVSAILRDGRGTWKQLAALGMSLAFALMSMDEGVSVA